MLTRRGWSLLGAATGLCIGSRLLGLVQLVVLAVDRAAAPRRRFDLGAAPPSRPASPTRHLRERLQVGVDGRVDIDVESRAVRRLPTVSVSDAFDGGRRSAAVPARAARARRHGARRVPAPDRSARPVRARPAARDGRRTRSGSRAGRDASSAPKRSSCSRACTTSSRSPRPAATISTATCRARTAGSTAAASSSTSATTNPATTCAACTGARPRARQRLMVRQNEARRRTPVLVMLDVRPGRHDRASFERAVEACASIVNACELAQRPYELVLSTGVLIGASGRRHLASVMDELAVVRAPRTGPHRRQPCPAPHRRARRGDGRDARRRQRRAERAVPRRRDARSRDHTT